MPEQGLRAFERDFRDVLDGVADDDLCAGVLIAASAADERASVPRAVASLTEWLAGPRPLAGTLAGCRRADAAPRQAEPPRCTARGLPGP